jgi:chemotaxis protein CheD
MYRLLHDNAVAPRLCEAYVYGGGNMFPDLVQSSSVGDDNVRCVFDALAADGIPVVAHDVGGSVYRRLRWTVGPEAPQVVAVEV